MAAYYCFTSFGWPPSKYAELPLRERLLIVEFIKEHGRQQEKLKARR